MAYDTLEGSVSGAQPVELYRWQHAAEVVAATSADAEQTHEGVTYTPAAIERGAVVQGDDIQRADLDVVVPAAHPVAALFSLGPPVDRVLLTVYRRHAGDAETVPVWRGRVLSCEWSGIQARLRHEPQWTAIRRAGLRRVYGYTCPHVLYGSACGVVASGRAVAGTVATVSGVAVTVAAAAGYADGWFRGGYLLMVAAGTGRQYRAWILAHAGAALTLHLPLALVAGDAVTMYPGCDRSLDTCTAKFANAVNFGGFPWTPSKSPHKVTIY
jgi:uncharacterized phage protein (TIGR02218 family)